MNQSAWADHELQNGHRLEVRLARSYHRTSEQKKRAEMWKTRALRGEWNGYRHCVYCGAPADGPVCWAHSDLLELDVGAPR